MADGFKDDLEEIRKVRYLASVSLEPDLTFWQEPNLGQSRLALLIDSLASGANVFSSSSENGQMNEVEAAIAKLDCRSFGRPFTRRGVKQPTLCLYASHRQLSKSSGLSSICRSTASRLALTHWCRSRVHSVFQQS
jgi:hypothetical protein